MSSPTVGYAVMPIVPSLKGLDAEINRQLGAPIEQAARKSGAKAGKSFRSAFGEIGIDQSSLTSFGLKAVAVGGIAALGLGKAAQAAGNLNAAVAASGQVFGNSQREIEAWSKGSADAIGLSRRAAVEAATSFGAFGKQAGLQGPELSSFSTGLTELAADLAAFKNVSVDEALQALQSGLAGESEPLRKYQVLLSDAQLRIEAVKLGLISTTQEALTPQNRVLAANSLIFEQAADKIGQFEREQGGLGTTTQQLTANFEDAQAALGQALLPALTSAASAASDALQSFSELDQSTQGAAGGIAAVAAGGTLIVGGLSLAAGAGLKLSDAYGRVRAAGENGNRVLGATARVAPIAARAIGAAGLAFALYETAQALNEASKNSVAFETALNNIGNADNPKQVAAAIQDAAAASEGWGEQLKDLGANFGSLFADPAIEVEGFRVELDNVEDVLAGIKAKYGSDSSVLQGAIDSFREADTSSVTAFGAVDRFNSVLDEYQKNINSATGGELAGELTEQEKAAAAAAIETEDLADAQKELDAATGSLTRKQALLGFEFDSNAAAAQGYLNAIERSSSSNALLRSGVGVGSALRQLRDGLNGSATAADIAEDKTDRLGLALDRMNDALEWGNPQLSKAAVELGAFKAAADGFRRSMDNTSGLRNQVSSAIQLGEAYRDFSKTVRRIPPELDMVSLTLGQYRPRTVEAIQSTLALGSAFTDYLSTLIEAGRGTEYVRSEAARFRGELERQLRQAGLTDAQVRRYLETLNATPEAVETAIRVSGEDAARFKVQSLLQLLEGRIPEAVSISVGNAISSGDLEGAARQLSNLAASNPVKIPLEVDAEKAVQQAESDLLRLPPTIDFVKAALGGYTEEQERGIEAFLGLGDAAQEFISKLVGGGQIQQAKDYARDLGVEVKDLALQMGASKEGAEELLTTLGLQEWQVEAGITLAGFDRTVFEITTLLSLLDEDLSPEQKREIGLKIAEGDLEGAVQAVKTEVLRLEQDRVELQIDALTDPATGQVNIWRAFTEANVFPVVGVGANTGLARDDVDAFRAWAAAQPALVTVEAKWGRSWEQFTWFLRPGGTPGGIDGDPRTPFRDGGLVTGPGTGRSDSIPAWLSNGEYVIPEMRVRQYGLNFLEGIRAGSFDLKGKNPAGMTLAQPVVPSFELASPRPEGVAAAAGGVHVDAHYHEVREAPTPEDLVRGVGSAMWRGGLR